jgi:hypothetical protein
MKISMNRLLNSGLAMIGFLLSPLSWWNDLVVNIPLAYAFSWPFSLLSVRLFLPAFVTGYWLTNLLGFVLLHRGLSGLLDKEQRSTWNVKRDLLVSAGYTLLILLCGLLGWIKSPAELLPP